jgi:hypothetical protein
MPREIDPQTRPFYRMGYLDGVRSGPKCAPDECRRLDDLSDYYAGWDAGNEYRYPRKAMPLEDFIAWVETLRSLDVRLDPWASGRCGPDLKARSP